MAKEVSRSELGGSTGLAVLASSKLPPSSTFSTSAGLSLSSSSLIRSPCPAAMSSSSFAKQKLKAAKEAIAKHDWVSVKGLAEQIHEYEPENYTASVHSFPYSPLTQCDLSS
jgi:hypothetical protein